MSLPEEGLPRLFQKCSMHTELDSYVFYSYVIIHVNKWFKKNEKNQFVELLTNVCL